MQSIGDYVADEYRGMHATTYWKPGSMKLLIFSDLHCHVEMAQSIVLRAEDADVIIGAGDFAQLRRGIEQTIDVLKEIARPTILVPGNSESLEELQQACHGWSAVHVLHGTGVSIDGVDFYGLGAAVPETPFGSWSYDLSEQQAGELLVNCPAGGVLVSHSPPKGVVDISSSGDSLGSVAVRETILAKSPQLVVCGHIHESWEKTERLQDTTVVNAGPRGQLVDLRSL